MRRRPGYRRARFLPLPAFDLRNQGGGKPVAVIGSPPGGFGTIVSQNAWLPVLRTLGTHPWFGDRLLVSRAHTVFDESGALTDERIQEQLRQFLLGFTAFITAGRTPGRADPHG